MSLRCTIKYCNIETNQFGASRVRDMDDRFDIIQNTFNGCMIFLIIQIFFSKIWMNCS